MEPKIVVTCTARIRQKGQLTLPKEVQKALRVQEGDTIRFGIRDDGVVTMEGYVEVPADQRWFWTPEWQSGEREAEEQIRAGETTRYHDVDEMLDDLDRRFPPK